MLSVRGMKRLDTVAGSALARLLPRPRIPAAMPAMTGGLLLIRPGGIGDAVHLAPAIRLLAERFPHAPLDVLAERRNAGAFALCPGIRELYQYDRPAQLLQVLGNRYDVVIDTEQWHRLSAVVARGVRAPVKIGFAGNERARLFTHTLPYAHEDYETASFLRLLAPLGIDGEVPPEEPWLQVPEDALAVMKLQLPEPPAAGRRVVIFPGASIAERRWGTERFREVACWCLDHGHQVVVVGGDADRADAGAIVSGLPAVNLAGETTLAETAAVIALADLVVSGDSGVLHIAVGLGCPTVALFGPGIAAKWAPRANRHVVLDKRLACSPCTRFGYTPACPHGVRCLREIVVADVTAAIAGVLARRAGGEIR